MNPSFMINNRKFKEKALSLKPQRKIGTIAQSVKEDWMQCDIIEHLRIVIYKNEVDGSTVVREADYCHIILDGLIK